MITHQEELVCASSSMKNIHLKCSAHMEYFLNQVGIFHRVGRCFSTREIHESTFEEFIQKEARQVVGTVPAGTYLTCPSSLWSDGVASSWKGVAR
jgi:hypothetical protein